MRNNLYSNNSKIKKIGLALIAIIVITIVLFNIKLQSVSAFKAQQQSVMNQYNLVDEEQTGDIKIDTKDSINILEDKSVETKISESDSSTIENSESNAINSSIKNSIDSSINNKNIDGDGNNITTGDGSSINDSNNQNTSNNGSEVQVSPTKNQSEYVTCSIEIRSDAISSNIGKWSNLDKDKSKIVPTDGIILGKINVTVQSGSSVYDVLTKAAYINNIELTTKQNYIISINQLAEKDAGSWSGWMYKVNDKSPTVACSSYYVKNGDVILWYYVI